MPLTNAQRQALYRQRKRNGPVTTPDVTLPGARRLMQAANAMARGVPAYRALEDAGYNGKSAQVKDAAQALLKAELQKHAVGVATVISSVKEGMDATTPVWNPAGNESINRPDWNARAQGRRDAIALLDRAGELPAVQAQAPHTQITVNVLQFGRAPIPDVVAHADRTIDLTSDSNNDAP